MSKDIDYKAAYERQKLARERAEDILENKARELYESNQSLLALYTKLKDQKAQLLHQEKLASIGQLAAGVAHEINNPTGFVKSNTNTLKRYVGRFQKLITAYDGYFDALETKGVLPESMSLQISDTKKELRIDNILQDVEEIFSESLLGLSRIEDIVKSLKNFARPESDERSRFDINECITDTLKLVQNEIKYKADLNVNLSEVPVIFGYPGEISQVVLNLVVNASQAFDNHGKVDISTSYDDNTICLTVSDNGCGISEEHVNKIFDPFFTTKDVNMGTGLGLSITHGIIKKHGGEIEVITKKGEGTTFKVILPVMPNAQDDIET